MKKLFSILLLVFVTLAVQAQIHQPVKWKIKLEDSQSAEKEIVFAATIDKGWHLYDMNLPEGGPVSTSFTFETLQGAELIGQPVSNIKPTVVYDEQFAMDLRWFPGAVTFTQKVKILNPKKFKIEGEVEFMVCNDETCLPPDRVSFAFDSKNTKLTLPADAPVVEKDDVTEEQPDTNQVAEEGKTLTTPDPVAKEETVIANPEKIANALTTMPLYGHRLSMT